jgi:predicted aminopeptidase
MVNRYPVNWLDRGVIEAVDAADYDALAARLAEAERVLRWARDCLGHPDNIAVIDRYFAGATDSANEIQL